ncbi:hypothetical protein JCM10908_006690 [Rhodotorula pacifica]|uniref:uncharacterized protein n=1 Tax=Rhodotorula pacifica TaxID=1495444 RepID=UPI003174C083
MPQPPIPKAGVLSLVALTVHSSCFSIVLHIARTTPGGHFNASSSIFLAEVVKIFVSIGLVAATGELHEATVRRKQLQEEERAEKIAAADPEALEERRLKSLEEEQRLWAGLQEPKDAGLFAASGETAIPVQLHRRNSSASSSRPGIPPQPGPKSPKNNLSINVALAQGKALPARAPSFALIPATPMPIPSPTRTPDVAALHPDRLISDPTHLDAAYAAPAWSDLGEREWWGALRDALVTKDLWHLAVLACLFCFQGNAQFIASGNLSVPFFLLAYQLKIPATALCSVYLLNRVLTRQQWFSLSALAIGVGLVQLSQADNNKSGSNSGLLLHDGSESSQAFGLAAVIAASISSGWATVYFERMLKSRWQHANETPGGCASRSFDSPMEVSGQQIPLLSTHIESPSPEKPISVWMRNIQLAFFGLFVSIPFVLWDIGADLGPLNVEVVEPSFPGIGMTRMAFHRFFDGFDRPLPWLVVLLQASGGLLSALVMLYADNLLKCYSVSVSIVLSYAASIILFQFRVSPGVFLGCILVLISTWTYAHSGR